MDIFETLSKLKLSRAGNGSGASTEKGKRKEPSYIYLDEQDNQIKETPLSKLDSAGSALIHKSMKKKINEARLIHDSIFGK